MLMEPVALFTAIIGALGTPGIQGDLPVQTLNQVSKPYVILVLSLGHFDKDYVDAYYGPAEWRQQAKEQSLSLQQIEDQAKTLSTQLAKLTPDPGDRLAASRHRYLTKQMRSMMARIRFLKGEKLSFDEESRQLYDATAPNYDRAHFQELVEELDGLLPGSDSIHQRVTRFRSRFEIPKEKIDRVFKAAIEEGRKRTAKRIALPDHESFEVEYVTDKAWSGYNWYKGNAHSLIQVNTDFPITIDRAVDLACHEGYPGHHVYNVLIETHLVKGKGWLEFSVYPLFSPQSLIAEGSANFGIKMAFPKDERLVYEKEVLFPLAGLNPHDAEHYYRVLEVISKLNYAGNEAARGFLDGQLNRDQTLNWLQSYALFSPDRATQRLAFIEKYRSYVINYNLGQDMVESFVIANGGREDRPEQRWKVFKNLLSTPFVPSQLVRP